LCAAPYFFFSFCCVCSFSTLAQDGAAASQDAATPSAPDYSCTSFDAIDQLSPLGRVAHDPAHKRLLEDDCTDGLLAMVTSAEKIAQPCCDIRYGGFTKGDLAVRLLLDKTRARLQDILPAAYHVRVRQSGIFAYYLYVRDEPGARQAIQARLAALLAEKSPAE